MIICDIRNNMPDKKEKHVRSNPLFFKGTIISFCGNNKSFVHVHDIVYYTIYIYMIYIYTWYMFIIHPTQPTHPITDTSTQPTHPTHPTHPASRFGTTTGGTSGCAASAAAADSRNSFNFWCLDWLRLMFPKIVYPQIIHFNRAFHYKPSILGTPFLETPRWILEIQFFLESSNFWNFTFWFLFHVLIKIWGWLFLGIDFWYKI